MQVQQAALELAADAVFAATKRLLGDEAMLSSAVIVGGAALWRFTKHRPTADVDIWLTGKITPRDLKRALPSIDKAFRTNMEAIHGVTFLSPSSRIITPVDFVNIKTSATERYKIEKRDRDIADIQTLLEVVPGPLQFAGSENAEWNKEFVRGLVPFLVEHSHWSKGVWLAKMGLEVSSIPGEQAKRAL